MWHEGNVMHWGLFPAVPAMECRPDHHLKPGCVSRGNEWVDSAPNSTDTDEAGTDH